jgi:hypothetical protein
MFTHHPRLASEMYIACRSAFVITADHCEVFQIQAALERVGPPLMLFSMWMIVVWDAGGTLHKCCKLTQQWFT